MSSEGKRRVYYQYFVRSYLHEQQNDAQGHKMCS